MSWLIGTAGTKHPDNMTRTEMIKTIKAIEEHKKAMSWWLKYASHKISRQAFNDARNA